MAAAEHDTGEAILAAAADLIGERGYGGTTTRAIAERAGVNEVTLFRHFGSKKGVLRALGESWAGSMAGFAVSDAPDPSDTRGTLLALARMEVEQAQRLGAAAVRLAFDATCIPEVMEVMGSGPRSNMEGLSEYLAARQSAGDLRSDIEARVMADAFFAFTSSFVMSRAVLGQRLADDGPDLDETVRQMLEVYLQGIGIGGAPA